MGTRAIVLPGEALGFSFEHTLEVLQRGDAEGGRLTGSTKFEWPSKGLYGLDGPGGKIFVVTDNPHTKTPT